jgi:hypothetical protein
VTRCTCLHRVPLTIHGLRPGTYTLELTNANLEAVVTVDL